MGLLDRAAEIRRRADAARAKARAIIPALFLDTFGDPATNPKGWPVVTVGDLRGVELRNGISPSKTGKVIGNVLTLSAITRGSFDPNARKESTFAGSLAVDQTVSRSLFLICRGNGNRHLVGQGAFPTSDMPGVAFPDTMFALRILESEIAPSYLAAVWSSAHLRAQIDAAAKTTNGTFKISQSAIVRFSFPLPPPELQTAFAEQAHRLESLTHHLDAAAAKAEAMVAGAVGGGVRVTLDRLQAAWRYTNAEIWRPLFDRFRNAHPDLPIEVVRTMLVRTRGMPQIFVEAGRVPALDKLRADVATYLDLPADARSALSQVSAAILHRRPGHRGPAV